jgi:hypothetical protein
MKTSVAHVEKFLLGRTAYSNKICDRWCAISGAMRTARQRRPPTKAGGRYKFNGNYRPRSRFLAGKLGRSKRRRYQLQSEKKGRR